MHLDAGGNINLITTKTNTMSFEITGKIHLKKDEQVISDKFKKREFVIVDESSQFPQHVIIQLSQDKTSLIDSYKEGDVVTVHFNIRGREWTSPQGEVKYFNTLDGWRINKADGAPVNGASVLANGDEEQDSDLPW